MSRKKTNISKTLSCAFILILTTLQTVTAEQEVLRLGRDTEIQEEKNVELTRNGDGFPEISIRPQQYLADPAKTDLLIHFEGAPLQDRAGNYSLEGGEKFRPLPDGRIGRGAGKFVGSESAIRAIPIETVSAETPPLFHGGRVWNDFSIEFWIRPQLLEDGEQVFHWSGQRQGREGIELQEITARFDDRKLEWRFQNLFHHPDKLPNNISLRGRNRLIPGRWSHHLLRYDSQSGLLEYLVNGVPEAVDYSRYRDENGRVQTLSPMIGTRALNPPVIAPNYTGLLDEFRLSRDYVENPQLAVYPKEGASVVIGPLELEEAGSELSAIDVVHRCPPGTNIFSYYRLGENPLTFEIEKPEWRSFVPGAELSPGLKAKYLQVKYELYPDGQGMQSPRISSTSINYRPNLPPPAPAELTVIPGDSEVEISWTEIRQRDLGGYLLYYGRQSGVYRSRDAEQGASPIDVGTRNKIKLSDLENGQLYYFAVAAYDTAGPSHRSQLSPEKTARPSRYYGD
ncbi:MAG TPA: hypothetical protein ENN41_10850 [Sediminispirochaeta sp.]|nr:hypothetical protein [Sediminispirochaeta sp.]